MRMIKGEISALMSKIDNTSQNFLNGYNLDIPKEDDYSTNQSVQKPRSRSRSNEKKCERKPDNRMLKDLPTPLKENQSKQ
jgi:hypothetical protein